MYKIRRCTICGHPIHVHIKPDGYVLKNTCGCISKLEVVDFYGLGEGFEWHHFSESELENFFETMGYWDR